jgi:molybdopterin molybdotransferase
MSKKIKNSCINEFDPTALDENKAIKLILKSISGKIDNEIVDIKNALGRVLYQNIKSHINIPSFKNSAMDGYAVNIKNLKKNNYSLNEVAISFAGKSYSKKLKNKETVKVMTGALIPDNADAVIMKEMTTSDGKEIKFKENIKKKSKHKVYR